MIGVTVFVICAIVVFLWLMITWPNTQQPEPKTPPIKKLVLPIEETVTWPTRELEPPATDLGMFAKQPNHCELLTTEEFNKILDALYDPKNNHLIE